MTPDEWQLLKGWFTEAIAAPEAQRQAWVARAGEHSAELARELSSLLEVHGRALETRELRPPLPPRPEAYPESLPAGAGIGPYRVLREIGRGGTGVVFLAERADDEFHRQVALKMLRYQDRDTRRRAALTEERRALSGLHHGHVATLLDWGTTAEGTSWLATEFVAGVPIDAYCQARQLAPEGILDLFLQVCQAVGYAHGRSVVHRDLKPGNILVTAAGEVKLLDFGISLASDAEASAGVARAFTPLYASPEQLRGEATTAASDIYSLGVVLEQLLRSAGRPSVELAAVLRRALAPSPDHRYATVDQLAGDLARIRRGWAPALVAIPWKRRVQLFGRRHRAPAVALPLAAVVVSAVWAWHGRRVPAAPAGSPVPPAMTFAPQPWHQASPPRPVRLVLARAGQVVSVRVLTQGAGGLDFSTPDATPCLRAFAAGQTCTVPVTFTPGALGLRQGAVVLADAQGHPLATTFIDGRGEGRLERLAAPALTTYSVPPGDGGLVEDAADDYFFAGWSTPLMELQRADGGHGQLRRFSGLHFTSAGGGALDGAGNLYLCDSADGAWRQGVLYKIPVVAGVPNLARAQAIRGINSPQQVTTDGLGNIFLALGDGHVLRLAADRPFAAASFETLADGLCNGNPQGLLLDRNGDLYCSGAFDSSLDELGGVLSQPLLRHRDFVPLRPWALGQDAAGNLYFSDGNRRYGGSGILYKIPRLAGGLDFGAAAPTGWPGPRNPRSIVFDGRGNVAIGASDTPNLIYLLHFARAPKNF